MIASSYATDDDILLALSLRRRDAGAGVGGWRFDPIGYIRNRLGWEPWRGTPEYPGQADVLEAYAAALRQQIEQPGAPVQNRIRIEAGHNVGKTKLAAGIVSHFFDSFNPSVTYCFAPGYDQINDLLFKYLRSDRSNLPGRVLETPEIKDTGQHFVKGRATNNSYGQGSERIQGQHEEYLLFVIDEAEGVADYVFEAIDSMTSGGVSIVLMLANPRTRTSQFHKQAGRDDTQSFRISCLHHPNVIENRDLIPGAVRRAWVEQMIDNGREQHCEVVDQHDADAYTFELAWRPGVIYKPDPLFLWRVRGIAPVNMADDTFVPIGRYDAARKRASDPSGSAARMGVDVARYGSDQGRLYIRRGAALWHAASFAQQDSNAYIRKIKAEAERLAASGVTSLHIRVDGGGGFGSGVIVGLKVDEDLKRRFTDFRVLEVHFNGAPSDPEAYADTATEIYAHTAETLQAISLRGPDALEADLCERAYRWVKLHGVDVKKLTPKEDFRRDFRRSPDDGDGAALACAPDYLWERAPAQPAQQSHSIRTW